MNQRQFVAVVAAFAAGVAVGANWPAIKDKLGPILDNAGDKAGDFYSALARMMSECKEGFEDKMAEKKHPQTKEKSSAETEFMSSLSETVDDEEGADAAQAAKA